MARTQRTMRAPVLKKATSMTAFLLLWVVGTSTLVNAGVVRLCLPATFDPTVASACSALLNQASTANATTYQCVSGGSGKACAESVAAGTAELTKLGGSDMFNANGKQGLLAYAAEVVSEGPAGVQASYFSVAVTTKATCDAIGTGINLASFKDKNACMTGYGKTAGWVLPMGYMMSEKIIPIVDDLPNVQQDAESVAAFFGDVCAAGVQPDGPTAGGTRWDPLCAACKGDCSAKVATEPYTDYEGSLHCLMAGGGAIAFTKHTTPLEYASDGVLPAGVAKKPWSTLAKADLRLICPNGGCVPVDDWASCYLARAATHAFLGKPGFAATPDGAAAIETMSTLDATLIAQSRALAPALPNLLFTDSAKQTVKLATPENFASHFGANALKAFSSIYNVEVAHVRICTQSAAEQAFCTNAVTLMNSKNVGAKFSCVEKSGDIAVLQAIKSNECDMKAFDGPDIYNGFKDFGLKAIVAEDYGAGGVVGTDYYSVAVVRKEWCDNTNGGNPTFRNLQGARMCSTGYRRSAGWVMPTGFLVQSGVMPIVRNEGGVEDDAESVAAFFSGGTCAARAVDNGPANTADKTGTRWDPLCKLCKGDCSSDIVKEPYYDYTGALRCVMEGAADVAFTKHTIAQDYAKDGSSQQPWSSLNQADMRLLCPRGGCVPVTQAAQCHVATSAAHAVLVRTEYADTEALKAALVALSKDNDFRGLVFNKDTNSGNHLFKSATYQLVPINDDTRSYLGSALAAFQGFDAFNAGSSTGLVAVPSDSSDGDSGLSTGAIVGISIGCAVGGALLAVLAALLINRRGQKKVDELKTVLSSASADKVDMKANGY